MRGSSILTAVAMLAWCGCRSQQRTAGPAEPTRRETPLDVAEVEEAVRKTAPAMGACYRQEHYQLGASDPASFVLQVRVGTDGRPVEVAVVKASIEGQDALQLCLVQALAQLSFPEHPGKRITLNIPIEAPR